MGEPKAITRVLKGGRGRQRKRIRGWCGCRRERKQRVNVAAVKIERGAMSHELGQLLEAGEGEEMDLPLEPLEGMPP